MTVNAQKSSQIGKNKIEVELIASVMSNSVTM